MVTYQFRCPVCGEEVHPNAKACRACGADERSGWRADAEDIDAQSALGLPGEEFDYEAFLEEEFGAGRRKPQQGWLWWAVGIALLVALVFLWTR
jgi:hypothetical protein